jgi:hypothetical protein
MGTDAAMGTDATPGADIVGTAVIHHVTESGTVDTAIDLVQHPVVAYFEDSPGHFLSYAATASPGGFTISGLPAGPFVLEIGRSVIVGGTAYIETSQRTIDASWSEVGRIDGVEASGTTELGGILSGLESWQTGDQLIATCGNLPRINVQSAMPAPDVGSTMYTSGELGALMLSATTTMPLIDGSKGDQVWVAQARVANYNAGEYGRIVKAVSSTSLEEQDVVGTALVATLADVPQTSATFTWQASQFGAVATGLAVDEKYVSQSWGASAALVPNEYAVGLFAYTTMDASAADATPTVAYGDPYPASWTRLAYASGFAKSTALQPATWMVAEPLASLDGSTLAPVVGPATALEVGGMAATNPLIGVGTSPIVSWTAPATGTPTSYEVVVANDDGKTATIMTKSISVTIPPGMVASGHQFEVTVRAHADATRDPELAPFALDTTFAYVDTTSVMLTP